MSSVRLAHEDREQATASVKIEGLDEILREKLRPRQNILLLGSPFTGKTTLAIQFLASGLKAGEAGILVTTTDTPDGMRTRAQTFGWDLREHEESGQLKYIDCYSRVVGLPLEDDPAVLRAGIDEEDFEKISLMISAIISDYWREGKRIRFVFDNLSTLFHYNDDISIARFLHSLLGRLKAVRATSILILESGVHDEQVTTLVRSLCDGALQLSGDGEERYIQGILGAGSLGRLPIEISNSGLRPANPPTNRTT